jgi:hypothetical protein
MPNTRTVSVSLYDDEVEALYEAAEKQRVTLSSYLIWLLERDTKNFTEFPLIEANPQSRHYRWSKPK